MLSSYTFSPFSATWVMASRAEWGPAGRLTPSQPPAPLSAALWAQGPAQGHSTAGQDVTLPSLLQDGAGAWQTTSLVPCFLLKESSFRRGESSPVTWEIVLHLVLLPRHIWRKREIKQHRVETWSILRAAEIGTTSTLSEKVSPRASLGQSCQRK